MNLYRRILLVVTFTALMVPLKAVQTGTTKQPSVQAKIEIVDEGELEVFSSSTDNSDIVEQELLCIKPEAKNKEFYPPLKQYQNQTDSIVPYGITIYFELLKPVIRNIKNEDIEIIEIL